MSAPIMNMWEIGWMEPLVGKYITTDIVDFEQTEVETELSGYGFFTAFETNTEKQSRGMRTWRTCRLYCDQATVFHSDDIIEVAEGRFRISRPKDWSRRGYNCYQLTEDYNG